MSNLAQRLITGTIFVVVLVVCIWWSAWSMFILFLAITVLGLNEFYNLSVKANAQPQKYFGIAVGTLGVISMFLMKGGVLPILNFIFVPLIFMPFIIELWRKKENPFGNVGWTLLGLFYIALPCMLIVANFTPDGFLIPLPLIPESAFAGYDHRPILALLILIWVSDSLAYVCGRLFGKHKLWERISPKKTWEGFFGGMIFTIATGFGIGYWWIEKPDPMNNGFMWAVIGLVISVTGVLGDLSESMFKRSIDVKDSGTILPGHGGILDRFDAFFLAVPFALTVYWLYPLVMG